MRLVYSFKIKYTDELREQMILSNNLYNQANYMIKEYYKSTGKYLSYPEVELRCKTQEEQFNNYRKIHKAQCAQQVLKILDQNWRSFFKSIKNYKKNPSKYKGCPKPPKYKEKGVYSLLVFTNQSCQIKENKIHLWKDCKSIKIPQEEFDFTQFQQVRFIPKKRYIKVEIIYNKECINSDLYTSKALGIDFGLDNLATCVSEDKTFIVSGKILKSINQFYNKTKAKLKSQKEDKGKRRKWLNTDKLQKLEEKRSDFIKDFLHKTSRGIVNFCLSNKISKIVVGHNKQWKDSIAIGKQNNQNLVSIPHSQLISYLKYKCELVGIILVEHEESYTSKCDALAFEGIKKNKVYLGKRIKRGLFQSSVGKLINADVNGALNILRKVISDSFVRKITDSGSLFLPVKIRTISELSNFCKNKSVIKC